MPKSRVWSDQAVPWRPRASTKRPAYSGIAKVTAVEIAITSKTSATSRYCPCNRRKYGLRIAMLAGGRAVAAFASVGKKTPP